MGVYKCITELLNILYEGDYTMNNYKIAVQRNLKEVIEMLKGEGFDVVIYEDWNGPVDVTILSGINSEYEEIEPTQCRIVGGDDDKMLLIDATRMSLEKILHYVKTIKC